MLEVVIPSDKKMLGQHIKALKYALEHDTNTKDIQIHVEALKRLEKAYNTI